MIAASARGNQWLMDGTMIAGSRRGGIGENPMRNGRGDNWGPAPSPHPRTAASKARASARATLLAALALREASECVTESGLVR